MARSIPTADRGPDPVAAEVADLVHALGRRIGRAARAQLDPLGLTGAQVRALRTVARGGAPIRMGDLADALGVVPRSATSVVEALAELGLVARQADATDRRVVAVTTTAAGRELLAGLRRSRHQSAATVLAPLTPTELATLRDLLAKAATAPT